MLKKLILENWKSFRYAELPIDPLTVLIGTNASGKSNAIEALEFLKRSVLGEPLRFALVGDTEYPSIRGGIEWATLRSAKQFTLGVVVQGENENIDYVYSITLKATSKTVHLIGESLIEIKNNLKLSSEDESVELFKITVDSQNKNSVHLFIDGEEDSSFRLTRSESFLGWLTIIAKPILLDKANLQKASSRVFNALKGIFVLDPIPSKMRSYSPLFDELSSDASNIAGVLAILSKEEKTYIESILSAYVIHLPERDIQRVWAEPVGRLGSDAMLYCEESWASDEPPMVVDARGMSDGTLRFLAIVTALLTRPEGSQLVIEEVDNGLHPSRAELLLKMLKELGAKRKIDILMTTHNPALLNALEPEMIPFVVVAHRDAQTGESKLTPLDDIQRLPKLLASGHIGDLATQGAIEKSLSQ